MFFKLAPTRDGPGLGGSTAQGLTESWLGPTIHVHGNIMGTADLVIDGSVEGTIQLDEGMLTVGAEAKLTADIDARDVVVHGSVKGNVHATRQIEIKRDGSVIGDLTTPQILIEDGADFKGSVAIDKGVTKEGDQGISSRAASAGAGRL